jgi:glycosyltransferase involved in cell wall biosynthesis
MKVWIITLGEPLSIDSMNVRIHRSGMIADNLQRRGHEVVFWTSTVDHFSKKQRFSTDKSIFNGTHYEIKFLYTLIYRKNISISRLINHLQFTKKFAKFAEKEEQPDLIITSYPEIFHSYEAVKYAKRHNIPVVVDVRDMWPEVFIEAMPKYLKPIVKLFTIPIYFYVKYIFKNATAVISILPFFLQHYQKLSNRKNRKFDRVFHHAYKRLNPAQRELEESYLFWQKYGINKSNDEFVVCFFGSIGSKTVVDLETVIRAAKIIAQKTDKIKFVLCGAGENLNYYKSIAKGCKNTIFPGWVDGNKIYTLLEMGAVGIIPYRNRFDFKNTIPNKAAEYLSGGLPILTCLDGYINEFLKPYGCVFHYSEDNSDELAEIILDLYSNPEKLSHSSQNALKAYEDYFSSDIIYNELVDYLERAFFTIKA